MTEGLGAYWSAADGPPDEARSQLGKRLLDHHPEAALTDTWAPSSRRTETNDSRRFNGNCMSGGYFVRYSELPDGRWLQTITYLNDSDPQGGSDTEFRTNVLDVEQARRSMEEDQRGGQR